MRKVGSALVLGLVVAACSGTPSDSDAGDGAPSPTVAEPTTVVETTTPPATDESTPAETTTPPVTDESTPAETITTIVTEASPTRLISDGEWVRVAVDEPWVDSVLGIEGLPGGGYVAVTGSPLSVVMWSPDGVDWFDGSPDRGIKAPTSTTDCCGPLAVTNDQVVVVDGTDFSAHVPLAIGDPRTGTWDVAVLDYTALDGRDAAVSTVNLAANADEVLVAATAAPAEDTGVADVVTWVVDPTTGTSETNSFAVPATPQSSTDAPLVAWVDGHWILIAEGGAQRNTLWTSGDGLEWSQVDLPDGMAAVHSLSAGELGVAAVNDGMGSEGVENAIWYSFDGLAWTKVPDEHPAHPIPVISVGKYGFVTEGETGLSVFADASEVYAMFAPFGDETGGELDELGGAGASSGDTLLILSDNEPGLWLYSAVTLTPIEWSVSDGGASMIVEASPLDAQDVTGIGASLIWEEATITLTSNTRVPGWHGSIAIREAGDGYVHIGDIFGFDERPDMEEAAATHGPPIAACIYVQNWSTVHEYCAPLAPAGD